MGIANDIADYDWSAALAALSWQVDLGVSEVIGDAPVDRYELPEAAAPLPVLQAAAPQAASSGAAPSSGAVEKPDTAALASQIAASCDDLAALRRAIEAFPHCQLQKGARNLVFGDGDPAARLMIIGDAPDRDEDIEGRPFAGRTGQLLDRMLAAIGLSRGAETPEQAAYLTCVMPWRSPGDREPDAAEMAMMRPFLARHIALVQPKVIIAMGNMACAGLLGKHGVLRLRGTWAETQGLPVMPMAHPSYLLRNPGAKREAWADLQAIQSKLSPV